MKVLIITENFKYGGLENNILSSAKYLQDNGHDIFFIIGVGGRKKYLESIFGKRVFCVNFKDSSSKKIIDEIMSITSFIGPDVVHAHPFVSLLYGAIISNNLGIPFVISLHGPASIYYNYPVHFIYLLIIFRCASMIFCVSEEVLIEAKKILDNNNLKFLPNGVDTNLYFHRDVIKDGRIAIVSRLDEDKITGIKIFFSFLSEINIDLFSKIDVFGEGGSKYDLIKWVEDKCPNLDVNFFGNVDDLYEYINKYLFIAGMGRVVIEAAAAKMPVMLIGYDGLKGFVDVKNFADYGKNNFSGRGSVSLGIDEFKSQLLNFDGGNSNYMLEDCIKSYRQSFLNKEYEKSLKEVFLVKSECVDILTDKILGDKNVNLFEESFLAKYLKDFNMKEITNRWGVSAMTDLAIKNLEIVKNLHRAEKEITILLNKNRELKKELNFVTSSRFWKIRSFYVDLKENIRFFILDFIDYFKKIFFSFYGLFQFFFLVLFFRKIFSEKGNIIFFQVDSFDKGGLEEVVYSLIKKLNLNESFKIKILVVDDKGGYMSLKAQRDGFDVVNLKKNIFYLRYIIKKLKPKLINLHYSVFGSKFYIKNNIPIIYTIHNNYIWADDKFVKERKLFYDKFKKFIAVSDQVGDFFSRRFDIDKNKIVTIPNGLALGSLNSPTIEKREDFSLKIEDFVFINVSSFNWNKFHILMICAVDRLRKKYSNIRLLFVGNPLDKNTFKYVKSEIKRRDLEGVIKIIDYVPKERVLGLMKMSDCFVLPSIIEGWSIAVMEAMYCELPLILSDIGSARNVIENNDIGIIINNPYDDVGDLNPKLFSDKYASDKNLNNLDDLCEAMEEIYLNAEEWKRRGKKGREKIVEKFNSKEMSKRYLDEYNKIIRL